MLERNWAGAPTAEMLCGADFPVCVPRKLSGLVAGFKTRERIGFSALADLEIGDTAGLETCATVRASSSGGSAERRQSQKTKNLRLSAESRYIGFE